jgi:hypothetical protein
MAMEVVVKKADVQAGSGWTPILQSWPVHAQRFSEHVYIKV